MTSLVLGGLGMVSVHSPPFTQSFPGGPCPTCYWHTGASSLEAAEAALDAFEATWGERFPMIVDSWRQRWSEISAFLAFPRGCQIFCV